MKTITGTWVDPAGNPVANGRLFLRLSQDAVAIGTNQIAPSLVSVTLNASGQIPASTQVWANDELTPAGTVYIASVLAAGGGLVWGSESLFISGASPINLNNLTPGVGSTGGAVFSGAVLKNPANPQTISGFSLTLSPSAPLITQGGGSLGGTFTGGQTFTGGTTSDTVITPFVTTASNELVLSETGDVGGVTKLHLRNRTGLNGILVDDPGQCLADVGLAATAVITNIAIDGSNNLTVTAAFSGTLPLVGQTVILTGLTTATFLNGLSFTIATISGTQFTAPFVHAAYASAPDTGTATFQINLRGEFRNAQISPANTTGEFQVLDPGSASIHWLTAGRSGTAALAYNTVGHADRQVILQNCDFEASTTILPPPGWSPLGSPTLIAYETSTPAPGKRQSLKLTTVAASSDGLQTISLFSALPGDVFSLQAYLKADGTSSASAHINYFDKNNVFTGLGPSIFSASTSWTLVAGTGVVPANSVSGQLVLNNGVPASTVWFDQISIQKTNFPAVVTAPQFLGSTDGSAGTPVFKCASGAGLFGVSSTLIVSNNGVQGPFFNANVNLSTNAAMYTLGAAQDTGISRLAAASIAIGNGTTGDKSGTIAAHALTDDGSGNFFRFVASVGLEAELWNGGVFSWSSTAVANGTKDTGLSRLGPGVIGVGTGSSGSTAGNLEATEVIGVGTGGGNACAIQYVAGGSGGFGLRDTSQGADLKQWDIITVSGQLLGRVVNDANSTSTNWLTVTRSAATATGVQLSPNLNSTRINPRTVAIADSATITPNSDTTDVMTQSNSQTGTITIAAPTGTPVDGQKLILRIKSTLNNLTYGFNATYHFSSTVIAPTTLTANKTDYIGCIWNATNSAWDVIAVDQGH